MRILRGHNQLPGDSRGAVIALGNFDGVHMGHRHVIALAGGLAGSLKAPLGAALFDPHPRRFFAPDAPTFRLMSETRRNRILESLGVEQLHILPFSMDMARMTPAEFVGDVLADGLGIAGIVTGEDFRFGAGRAGATDDLARLCADHGIATAFAELHGNGADKVSSTRIRKAIRDGDMRAAETLLGTPWAVEGIVQRGDQRGRTIGFPTANLTLGDYVRPDYGVYAVRVGVDGDSPSIAAVANIGKRPTVDGVTELLEIHLLDWSGDLYGRKLEVEFFDHLRSEKRFDGLEALKAQIAEDAIAARKVLSGLSGPA
ncbi:bifunctional riboflavin kinase/FMN adenylyltransferase [Maricaulis sp. W15]|uniref:bifunctional riboflavin kinase/FAD synthetase n=1 Tax=Maricaulis sp. W15 TaxID=1772333 RepID=UPI0009490321|nr:bifunctional riboflavin kinase/FAD synthetase [Maricaulis sp. W15]OLF81571.1 bifunctional riboflavin kinase/FMN adenylyltransferase [Maricaulis sp. W15]